MNWDTSGVMRMAYEMALECDPVVITKACSSGFTVYDTKLYIEAEELDLTGWRGYLVPASWEAHK